MTRATGGAGPASDRAAFVGLSAALTGFDAVYLEGTGLVDVYLEKIDAVCGGEVTDQLWALARVALANRTPEATEHAIRVDIWASSRHGPVVRSLLRLWYSGKWNPLGPAWQARFNPNGNTSKTDVGGYISAQGFIEGLMWAAVSAHPPGAKPPGYGSWSLPPIGEPAADPQ